MKILIWGTGRTAELFLMKKGLYKNDEIIAFVDNNKNMWNKSFYGKKVISPTGLMNLDFDKIIICVRIENKIKKQLIYDMNIPKEKITDVYEIENEIIYKLEDKYRSNQDQEIADIIYCFKKKGVQIFGNFFPMIEKKYRVYRDENKNPYIIFENKRIYYPNTYKFDKNGENEYIPDIFYEQYPASPHLYISDKITVSKESIIIDAGACEGNFTIRFIDKIKKAYLVEPDPVWVKCLEMTFQKYKDKVVICNKSLARYDSDNTITIDTLVNNEKIDFLKMDIEGAEIDALLGAKKMLSQNNVKCSICSYHKMNDEKNIRFIMETLGYKTDVSKGYMFFVFDEDIFETLDLRRGVVYAYKDY